MNHFHLLGSVFRSTGRKDKDLHDFSDPVINSGLIGRDYLSRGIVKFSQKPSTALNRKKMSRNTYKASYFNKTRNKPMPALRECPTPDPSFYGRYTEEPFKRSDMNILIQTVKPEDGPKVFYRSVLPVNTPPSSSNFIQLEELLDRLLKGSSSEDITEEHKIYELILTEIVRQYFIECSAQGQVLDKCRSFFNSIAYYIPRLKSFFQKELQKLQAAIDSNYGDMEKFNAEKISLQEKLNQLSSLADELKNDYDLLIGHFEELHGKIHDIHKEINNFKNSALELSTSLSQKNQELINLNEELRLLDEESAKYTEANIHITEKLKDVAARKNEILERISAKKKEYSMKKKEYDESNQLFTKKNDEILALSMGQELSTMSIQVDLIPSLRRAKLLNGKHAKKSSKEGSDTSPLENFIIAIGDQDESNIIIPEEGFTFDTYSDFSSLKKLILKHTEKYQIDKSLIPVCESGDFELNEKTNIDYITLFASNVTHNAIDSAIRSVPKYHVYTQVLYQPEGSNSINRLSEESLLMRTSFERLLIRQIFVDYSQKEIRKLDWIMANSRLLLSEKYQRDILSLRDRKSLIILGQFVVDYAKEHEPLEFLMQQFCWDINNTAKYYSKLSEEVEFFYDALLGNFYLDQLYFMLLCRDYVHKVGFSVPIKIENGEQTTEYYLCEDQLNTGLKTWWKDRYSKRFYNALMEISVARPAAHLVSAKRYVALTPILLVMGEEYLNDNKQRLLEILQTYRISPKLRKSEFNRLMLHLVPYSTKEDLHYFFKASISRSSDRIDVSVEDFIEIFYNTSILYIDPKQRKISSKDDELLNSIKEKFNGNKDKFKGIIDHYNGVLAEQHENINLTNVITDCDKFYTLTERAICNRQASEACSSYFSLVFSIDQLLCSMPDPDPEGCEDALNSLESCIKECWLDSMLEQINF